MGRDGGGSRRGCGFCLCRSQSCHCPGSAGKMLGRLLLWLLLATALCPGLLGTVSVQNLHLCEGYASPDGRYHPGFYCPRLTDPAGHRYCCRASPRALKSCCSQLALEALTGVNLSSLASPGLLRNPLALPFVGLYGLLVLLLMAVDLLHFYRTRRCRLGRLLPRACRPPCRPPGRRQPRSRPPCGPRAPGGLSPPPPGRAC
ncbi:protein shisa-like-1 [Aquila chrysaetos chrysaetos]|uniref:protein shisa-like-1 n=1 Tax=Aquila chrysaetos chrysaetos TaxID=223781 RepID=UPI001B7D343E|nr:protein shisa-like-1 [Aquila chrysaetos chrysaetos]